MTSPRHRYRVILVDDDPQLLAVTAALLEDELDVTCATSGAEALELAATGSYDIICTDFRMPGMNGIELLQRVNDRAPTMARILITGMTEHAAGAFGVIIKPYDPNTLASHIVRELEQTARMSDVG